MRGALFVALCAVVAAGCAGGEPADGDGNAWTWDIEPNGVAEVNLQLNASDEVVATFESSRDLAWDVHSHGPDGAVTHTSGHGVKGEIPFTAPSEGVYSYLWTNQNEETARIDVAVEGDGRVHSTHPAT